MPEASIVSYESMIQLVVEGRLVEPEMGELMHTLLRARSIRETVGLTPAEAERASVFARFSTE